MTESSAYTKRKYVAQEVEDFDNLPEIKNIAKVLKGRGNNLHFVQNEKGEQFLASMPTKFRKHVWVRRGSYVLIEPIEEGVKVKAEITHVLIASHIKKLKQAGEWPAVFNDVETEEENVNKDTKKDDYDSSDSSSSLESNPNHAPRFYLGEDNSDEEQSSSTNSDEDFEEIDNDDNVKKQT